MMTRFQLKHVVGGARQLSYTREKRNHHYHHHVAINELGHLLTHCGLTLPQNCNKVLFTNVCNVCITLQIYVGLNYIEV
jgi:hypothetical protein